MVTAGHLRVVCCSHTSFCVSSVLHSFNGPRLVLLVVGLCAVTDLCVLVSLLWLCPHLTLCYSGQATERLITHWSLVQRPSMQPSMLAFIIISHTWIQDTARQCNWITFHSSNYTLVVVFLLFRISFCCTSRFKSLMRSFHPFVVMQ